VSEVAVVAGPKRFTSDLVWVAASLVTFAAAGAAWAVITSHSLGAGGRGNLSLIGVVVGLGGLACSAGTGYTLPALLASGRDDAGAVVGAALAIGTAVNLVVVLGVVVAGAAATIPVLYMVMVVACMTLLPASWLKSVFGAFLGARRDFRAVFVAGAAGQAVQLGLGGSFAATGMLTVGSAVTATAAGAVVTMVGMVPVVLRIVPLRRLTLRTTTIRRVLRAAAQALPGILGQSLNYRVDLLVIASLAGAQVVGVYFVGVLVAETLFYPAQIVSQVLLPRAAQETFGGTAAAAYRIVSGTTIVLALGVFAAAPYLMRFVFGPEFIEASPATRALMPGIIALSLWQMATFELAGRGRIWLMSISAFVGVAVTLVLDLLLVPPYGVRGAAIAASVGYVATAAVIVPSLRSVLGYRFRDLLVPRREDLALVRQELRALRRQLRSSGKTERTATEIP
jgi:O-antigen/teichoic acid export membrane protein